MSHSHTHAPGEEHSHSHGPSQPQPQQPQMPTVDPAVQASIDAEFVPVPLTLTQDAHVAVCTPHKLEKCDDCDVDFNLTNYVSRLLVANPSLLCPPPPNIVSPKLTQMVNATKNEGNTLFKSGQTVAAIGRYTAAASLAMNRPPWEATQVLKEELSTAISNRSAAYFELKDYISALADAEMVIHLRRNWSKGHFRKAKALVGLGRLREAADAVRLGLDFEPTNTELSAFLADIEKVEAKVEGERLEKDRPTATS